MSPLLTIEDVAAALKVEPKTVYKWKAAGKIACIVLPGGDLRFREEWLNNWLEKKTIKVKS